ncbi:hypothetical protein D3C79_621420 [compost metagenome]
MGNVLFADIGLGAVGGYANGVDPKFVSHFQVIDGADTWQQQGRDLGVFHQRNYRRQVLFVSVRRKTIVHRAAAKAIAMGDFDQRHTRLVEAAGDVFHLLQADTVAFRVHAVAQAHVVNGDLLAAKFHGRFLRQWQVRGWHAAAVRP